jgi:hypothetical protein
MGASTFRHDLSFTYTLMRPLGSGVSAGVFQAEHGLTGDVVAIKIFTSSDSSAMHAAATEYICAIRSAGPSTLEYRALAFMDGKPAIVMELCYQALDAWIKARLRC